MSQRYKEYKWPWNALIYIEDENWHESTWRTNMSNINKAKTLYCIYAATTPREADIIEKIFIEGKSADKIGAQYGLTGGRIRQIKGKAIRKILKMMISMQEKEGKLKEAEKDSESVKKDILGLTACDLNLTTRPYNCLRRYAIFYLDKDFMTVKDIIEMPIESLGRIRNMGAKSVGEIVCAISNVIDDGIFKSLSNEWKDAIESARANIGDVNE